MPSTKDSLKKSLQPLNPFRKDTWENWDGSNHYALGKSQEGTFAYNFKKGFLIGYGRRDVKAKLRNEKGKLNKRMLDVILKDPAMATATSVFLRGPKQTHSNIGLVDNINPLVWLLLGMNLLGNKLSNKYTQLHHDKKVGLSRALLATRILYEVVLRMPISVATHLTQLVFNLVKAIVSVVIGLGYAIGATLFGGRKEYVNSPATFDSKKQGLIDNEFGADESGSAQTNQPVLVYQ